MPPKKQKTAGATLGANAPADGRLHLTVVLTGFRGCGKTHLGRAAAAALDVPFIDLDELYEEEHGKIMDTVRKEGWPVFRQREADILRRTLAEAADRNGRIVACGGGVVETETGRALLRAHWPVVQAMKPIDDVEHYLGVDPSRPSLGEPPRVAFERRLPWYNECSDLDHVAAPRELLDHAAASAAFILHLQRACALAPPAPMPHEHSFALVLTCADVAALLPFPSALWRNVDAVELRADRLSSLAPTYVQRQIALLRASCPLPLIFSCTTAKAGGAFVGSAAEYCALCLVAARSGVDWLTLEFYIFGQPTRYSPSPAMHSAGFAANGAAHAYGVCETERAEDVLEALRRPGAGGGSVTIPLKEQLMPHVSSLSAAAKAIGSLNTLTVLPDGKGLHADNTDWIGIRNLDVGQLHIFNRSTDKAEALASEFGGTMLRELHSGAAQLGAIHLLVSCVPGSAGLSLPIPLLTQQRPIVLDAAYRPRETPLLQAASAAGCVCIEGVEMLFEQGCAQCELWTHRPAPRAEIAKGLLAFLASLDDFGPPPASLAKLCG